MVPEGIKVIVAPPSRGANLVKSARADERSRKAPSWMRKAPDAAGVGAERAVTADALVA
jgi:hypothetical protein